MTYSVLKVPLNPNQPTNLLGPAFAASRMQHISYLHSKFTLGPQHV